METLKSAKDYRHPDQPALIYDISKPWEDVVSEPPIWLGQYPPLSTDAKYTFLGHKLISPVTIAAGPASGHLWTDFFFKMGYGIVMEKTRRTEPRRSNQAPNIAIVNTKEQIAPENMNQELVGTMNPEDWSKYQAMTNSFGNPAPWMLEWAQELVKQGQGVNDGQILAASVTATAREGGAKYSALAETGYDFVVGATAAAVAGVRIIELNKACPNVTDHPEEGEMFQDSELVKFTFAELKRRLPTIHFGFKRGLYRSKDQMRRVYTEAGENLDFVSGINALAMPVVDNNGEPILPGRRFAGTCGRPLLTIALQQLEWESSIREEEGLKFESIGGGGIVEAQDVDRFLNAGANVVFSGSAVLANPLLAYEYHLLKQG